MLIVSIYKSWEGGAMYPYIIPGGGGGCYVPIYNSWEGGGAMYPYISPGRGAMYPS